MAPKDPHRGVFVWLQMPDFNTSEETGKTSSLRSQTVYKKVSFCIFYTKKEVF